MQLLASAACAAVLAASPAAAQNCAATSTGAVPLSDLADGAYQGFPAGLYPGGVSHRPAAHDAAGLAGAAQVVPRDASGAPSPSGRIVLLSLGMSNATQEWSAFQQLVAGDATLNPRLLVVDGAIGGQTAQVISDPNAPYWSAVQQRVAQAGATAQQVQVVWLKTANAQPTMGFPGWALALRDQLVDVARIVADEFPQCRLLYVSSRTYGGYATAPLNPEPWAYESGFAFKWLVEEQIAGNPLLAPGEAPWIAWGPYLWADGLVPRADALTWECSDFASDGVHPALSGRQKVAALLDDFFRTDATARSWFLAAPTPICGPQARATKYGSAVGTVQLVPRVLPTVPSAQPFGAFAFGAPPGAAGAFAWGLAPLPPGAVPLFDGSLLVQPLVVVPAVADANGQARLDFGPLAPSAAACGAAVFFQLGVLDDAAPGGVALTRGLRVVAGH